MDVRPRSRWRCAVLQMLLGCTVSTLYQWLLCSFRVLSKVQRSKVSVASFGCDFGTLGVGRIPVRRLRALGKLWGKGGGARFMTTPDPGSHQPSQIEQKVDLSLSRIRDEIYLDLYPCFVPLR